MCNSSILAKLLDILLAITVAQGVLIHITCSVYRSNINRFFWFKYSEHILYSPLKKKFYTGVTQDSVEERIIKHNNHEYGTHRFTAISNDWELFLKIDVDSYSHAVRLERKIKSMKSSKYIQKLKEIS